MKKFLLAASLAAATFTIAAPIASAGGGCKKGTTCSPAPAPTPKRGGSNGITIPVPVPTASNPSTSSTVVKGTPVTIVSGSGVGGCVLVTFVNP